MIPRKINWFLTATIFVTIVVTKGQNGRSYDNNDWIPMPSAVPSQIPSQQTLTKERKAVDRVLTVNESPNQNFFPENVYKNRPQQRPPSQQQYLRETVILKVQDVSNQTPKAQRGRQRPEPLPTQPYLYEQPPQPPQRQHHKKSQHFREEVPPSAPLPQQYILQSQRPIQPLYSQQQPQLLTQPQILPQQNQQYVPQFAVPTQNYYGQYPTNYPTNIPNPTQYSIPLNGTIYEALNPGIETINHGLIENANNEEKLKTTTPKAVEPKETVQLVYVPLETLNQRELKQNPTPGFDQKAYHLQRNNILLQQQQQQKQQFQKAQQHEEQQIPQREPQEQQLQQQQQRSDTIQRIYQPQRLPFEIINKGVTITNSPVQHHFIQQDTFKPPPKYEFSTTQNPSSRKQYQLEDIERDFLRQALEAHRLQQQLQQQEASVTSTTPKPTKPTTKKRKPHQPPLAVFMESDGPADVIDVIDALKNSKTIAVQDTVGPDSPHVFVGPSTLLAPNNYAKFELPYLSSIENNRVERKVDNFPFFVAPLSYKAPSGYSKIPLPPPHVGSVVIADRFESEQEKPRQPSTTPYTFNTVRSEIQPTFNRDFFSLDSFPSSSSSKIFDENRNSLKHQQELAQISKFIGQTANQLQYTKPSPPTKDFSDSVNQIRQSSAERGLATHLPVTEAPFTDINPFVQNTRYQPTNLPQFETDTNPPHRIEEYRIVHSNRRTTQKPITTTPVTFENESDKYTVLEEFSAKQRTTTPKYDDAKSPHYYHQQQIGSFYTDQIVPSNRYNFGQQPVRYDVPQSFNQHLNKQVVYGTSPTLYATDAAETETFPPQTESTKKSRLKNKPKQKEPVEQLPLGNYEHLNENIDYSLPAELPPISPLLPGLINNLQDKSVRPLLVPGLLVPTTKEAVTTTEYAKQEYGKQQQEYEKQQQKYEKQQQEYEKQQQDYGKQQQNYVKQQEYEKQQQYGKQQQEETLPPTEIITTTAHVYTTQPPVTEATTVKRTRGRQRNRYSQTTTSTSTSSPRSRNVHRGRRPYVRTQSTQTEKKHDYDITTTEYSPVRDYYSAETTRRSSPKRQRFRTRGRPLQNEISTDRNFETSSENASSEQGTTILQPNVYVQNDQSQEAHTLINIHPTVQSEDPTTTIIKEYHPIYSFPVETTVETLTDQSKNEIRTDKPESYQITSSVRVPHIRTNSDSKLVRFSANTGGFLDNNQEHVTTTSRTRTTPRGRSRIRGRSRFTKATTTTTTTKTTTTTTNAPKQEEGGNFYGFFRPPDFEKNEEKQEELIQTTQASPHYIYAETYQNQRQSSSQQPLMIYSPEYDSNTQYQYEDRDEKTPKIQVSDEEYDTSTQLHYVNRNKYYDTTTVQPTTTEAPRTTTPTTPKSRFKGRIRLPPRKKIEKHEDSYTTTERYRSRQNNEVNVVTAKTEQITRRSSSPRSRSRGKSHFSLPENLKPKEKTDDDIEGENYPAPYLQSHELNTKRPNFQITIDPASEEDERYDQVPYSSIYSPQIVPLDDSSEEIDLSSAADPLPVENHISGEDNGAEITTINPTTQASLTTNLQNTMKEILHELKVSTVGEKPATTSLPQETTTKRKGRRRGVWKLVKTRPIDQFEASESQNIQSAVVNSLSGEDKNEKNEKTNVDKSTTITTTTQSNNKENKEDVVATTTVIPSTTSEGTIFDTLYEMLGMSGKNEDAATTTQQPEIPTTTQKSEETIVRNETVTTSIPILPDEIAEITTQVYNKNENATTPKAVPETTALPTQLDIEEVPSSNSKKFEVEPWQMRAVKTSTSTEISHGTVICYKGKCVKSEDESIRPIYQ